MKLRRNIKPISGPFDLTPLLNVVLLLLVFFLLGSTFVIQPGIKVNPPTALTGSGLNGIRYVINVTAQEPPLIFFNNQIIGLAELQAELRQLAARQPGVMVALRADQRVPYGMIMDIMSRALDAGVQVLNATQPAVAP
ncbi:MAG: biopolymer transporter ExbD [Verrucomicrobiales bacterium]|jgi:biopolymer transport protein ExbD|nr:biopolymer transporter ExbD [Verrucomicrobiales bacterium]MDR1304529.1 biopolymer transporter ExbD [Verrucomicrobiales bacterium]